MFSQKGVVIEEVSPSINCGAFPIKRVINESVDVSATALSDGHDAIGVSLSFKHEKERKWREQRMHDWGNAQWVSSFKTKKRGFYSYRVEAWIDNGLNWQYGIKRKIEDGQQVGIELLEGAILLIPLLTKVSPSEKKYIHKLISLFRDEAQYQKATQEAKSSKLFDLLYKYPEKKFASTSLEYKAYVDRTKARFSTWYEFFPRSASEIPGKHGTLKDCERLLPRIKEMGFDTLYLPPIHPIGEVNRKGKNNTTVAKNGDVGSTWGIGSKHGGHKDIHPKLGNLKDFISLIKKAKKQQIEIAMDFALQAAPDHPWVQNHPEWFKWRPDGTVQYAENPPKKYQDILPIYWEGKGHKSLWKECLSIMLFWIDCGVRIFRVDNPHTKPFLFWNWLIWEVKKKHPDVLFLSEAFTHPKVMEQLAKQGFTQSYTYFTWRETKRELIGYIEELTQSPLKDYFSPNFWPNTPDINPFHLQGANESKYIQRYALAATLSSNIGIYGPVFEFMLDEALPNREEYANSEKFQIAHYDWEYQNRLIALISSINQIRKQNEALQQTNNIKICYIENENLLGFYKWNETKTNEIVVVVNLDAHNAQKGMIQTPLHDLGLEAGESFEVHDLITENRYTWNQEWNYIALDNTLPFHIFKVNKGWIQYKKGLCNKIKAFKNFNWS